MSRTPPAESREYVSLDDLRIWLTDPHLTWGFPLRATWRLRGGFVDIHIEVVKQVIHMSEDVA